MNIKAAAAWIKTNALYVAAAGVMVITLAQSGCQPTAEYRGQQYNARELEVKRNADLRQIEVEMLRLQAEASAVVAEAGLAEEEIAEKQATFQAILAYVGDIVTTAATGRLVNPDDAIKGGLSLAMLLLGGGVIVQRSKKKAEDKGYDMGKDESFALLKDAGAIKEA